MTKIAASLVSNYIFLCIGAAIVYWTTGFDCNMAALGAIAAVFTAFEI